MELTSRSLHIGSLLALLICVHLNCIERHQTDRLEMDRSSSSPIIPKRQLAETYVSVVSTNHKQVRCRESVFETWDKCCINRLFAEYLDSLGFHHHASSSHGHKVVHIALVEDATSPLCSGLRIQSNAEAMDKAQSTSGSAFSVDLSALYHKSSLFATIERFARRNQLTIDFLPTTYRLDRRRERSAFFERLPCDTEQLWVIKTSEHGGAGIHLIDDPGTLRSLFWRASDIEFAKTNAARFGFRSLCNLELTPRIGAAEIESRFGFRAVTGGRGDEAHAVAARRRVIAQQFVADPLLVDGRKFHVRVFVLVASLQPLVVLYGGGVLILSARAYDATKLDKASAVTNRAVSRELGDSDSDWAWSFARFERYLKAHRADLSWTAIELDMKRVIDVTFCAALRRRKARRRLKWHAQSHRVALFAVDLLLTRRAELKLMEVQNAPKTAVVPEACSMAAAEQEGADWACSLGAAIAKETVDVAVLIAARMMQRRSFARRDIQDVVHHFQVLIFRDLKDGASSMQMSEDGDGDDDSEYEYDDEDEV